MHVNQLYTMRIVSTHFDLYYDLFSMNLSKQIPAVGLWAVIVGTGPQAELREGWQ